MRKIFDINHIDTPFWDDILHGDDSQNIDVKIVWMSPDDYLEEVGRRFGNNGNYQKQLLAKVDRPIVDELKEVVKNGQLLPLTFIDYTDPVGQDGRHRMMAVGELYGFDEEYPVAIFTIHDKAKWDKDKEDQRQVTVLNKLRKALHETLRYLYSDLEEFKEQLQHEVDRVFGNLGDGDDAIVELTDVGDDILIVIEDTDYYLPKREIKFRRVSDETSDSKSSDTSDNLNLDDLSLDELQALLGEIN